MINPQWPKELSPAKCVTMGPITAVNILISSWLATVQVSMSTFCQNHLVATCGTVVTEVRIHHVDSPDTQSFCLSTAQG